MKTTKIYRAMLGEIVKAMVEDNQDNTPLFRVLMGGLEITSDGFPNEVALDSALRELWSSGTLPNVALKREEREYRKIIQEQLKLNQNAR